MSSIRTRLLLAFVLIAMLSAFAISLGSTVVGYINGRQQVEERLDSVAALKALSIKTWADSLQTTLMTVSSDQFASQRVSVVLGLAKLGKQYVWYDEALRVRLHTFVDEPGQLNEICLLDLTGTVVLCSEARQEREDCRTESFFETGLTSPFTEIVFSAPHQPSSSVGGSSAGTGDAAQPPTCSLMSAGEQAAIAVVARPAISSEGETLGVIVGRAYSFGLAEILADPTGLGASGRAYLVSASSAMLAVDAAELSSDRGAATPLRSRGASSVLETKVDSSGTFGGYDGETVLGTYHWLPALQVVLAVEQSTAEAFAGIFEGLVVNLGIALVAALLAVALSFRVTRSITYPLVSLVETATRIADGDLTRSVPVMRDDEIGQLAASFNTMTAQLHDLVSHLEQRVEERTCALNEANEALRRRASQMDTSAAVSRQITSILEIDVLLARVVRLIRESFGHSCARIFLLDGSELVLRASTSETATGVARVELSVTSLNTDAVRTGQATVANDVAVDSRFLEEDLLPHTRSELSVPLRLGTRVIGTLDVLSDQLNAFTAEDVLVITSLGDQIAVAIENARLYAASRDLAVLEERNRLARDLHDSVIQSIYSLGCLLEGWRRLLRLGEAPNAEEQFGRAAEIAQQALKEMRLMVYELRPAELEQDGLLGAFQQRLDAVERRAGVKARLIVGDVMDLPQPIQECLQLTPRPPKGAPACRCAAGQGCRSHILGYALYHIGVEALTNALKHSAATEVTLHLGREIEQVVLVVADNGRGFDSASPECGGGMGLDNMRQRALEAGGSFMIESEPGKGTKVTARIGCAAFGSAEAKSA